MIPLHDDNPTTLTPFVTVGLIVACVAVFLWQVTLPPGGFERAVYAYGMIPAVLFGERALPAELAAVPATLSVVTAMFLHGGWMHLIGNMLYLWIFGNNVEDAMGHGRYGRSSHTRTFRPGSFAIRSQSEQVTRAGPAAPWRPSDPAYRSPR
jgi:membrane associated rhomboid family serine protease